ncbi:Histone chaperone ASF1 [Smittium culicis]|uniref:Anti-silencing function protein 1 n=1 Tax=Smittium culicis TaxID=133412 RepID=A0A1R1YR47_9FUNG|nr:Histone chaperone ASF1 [Smittium culicis]OMJ22020.1 Histone chaperone ASF1 [Smittium culicis]OMJ29379.1 Histone chaperone ASF1 [Smittium culicis]
MSFPSYFTDLEFKLIYVGSADDENLDQELDSILVGPVPVGVNQFTFDTDPPDVSKIPEDDILGVTVVLLTCSYKNKEFVRVGYYVNNEYLEEELKENPPEKPILSKIYRIILADKPRVTRFPINWDNPEKETSPASTTIQHEEGFSIIPGDSTSKEPPAIAETGEALADNSVTAEGSKKPDPDSMDSFIVNDSGDENMAEEDIIEEDEEDDVAEDEDVAEEDDVEEDEEEEDDDDEDEEENENEVDLDKYESMDDAECEDSSVEEIEINNEDSNENTNPKVDSPLKVDKDQLKEHKKLKGIDNAVPNSTNRNQGTELVSADST